MINIVPTARRGGLALRMLERVLLDMIKYDCTQMNTDCAWTGSLILVDFVFGAENCLYLGDDLRRLTFQEALERLPQKSPAVDGRIDGGYHVHAIYDLRGPHRNPGRSAPKTKKVLHVGVPVESDLLRYAATGECYNIADWVANEWPALAPDSGYFVRASGEAADHAWLEDRDGVIYDPTFGQFDRKRRVAIARPGTKLHSRYHSWSEHHAPHCLHRLLGVRWKCEFPGCDHDPQNIARRTR